MKNETRRPLTVSNAAATISELAVLGDRIDFRIALDVSEHHVAGRQVAELTGEVAMLIVVEELVAEEHHLPFHQRFPDVLDLLRRQRPRQVDPADFRADIYREWRHLDRIGRRITAPGNHRRFGHLIPLLH